ncbi:MAG: hypothetical protein NC432_11515, partial [Roseburia sp.]|nr:hypothetical protein [Roseburia sp.]MCM1099471.1 hypothetical protein [Ruminococcus flavefaciens]
AEQRMRAEEQRQIAEEQRLRADAAERNLKSKTQTAERAIAFMVKSFQKVGMTREAASKKLTEETGLTEEEANAAIGRYWIP